jgi:hypothetical protein
MRVTNFSSHVHLVDSTSNATTKVIGDGPQDPHRGFLEALLGHVEGQLA